MADTLDGVNPQLAAIARKIMAESGGRITITSGRRDSAEQQVLYDRYKAGNGPLAAKPGTSRHEHGEAIDFGGDMGLLAQLARKYGLSNSVPGEPWHWTLGGEEGSHTQRHSEYDLGDDTSAKPQDILANRMNSILRIIGSDTASVSPEYGDPGLDKELMPNRDAPIMQSTGDGPAGAPGSDGQPSGATSLSNHMAKSGPKAQLQQYAFNKLKEMGMGDREMGSLITLWNKESGWNPKADNPTSTAYGIAQFLNGTWAGTGYKKTSDPYQQIDAGLRYINQRYGSPSQALQFHLKNNWY